MLGLGFLVLFVCLLFFVVLFFFLGDFIFYLVGWFGVFLVYFCGLILKGELKPLSNEKELASMVLLQNCVFFPNVSAAIKGSGKWEKELLE